MPPSYSTASQHVEEEYTDYSCSTAIERLARDVETSLRSWHVDRGSDRHVSLSAATKEINAMNASMNGSMRNLMNSPMNGMGGTSPAGNNQNMNSSFSDNISVHSTGASSVASTTSTTHLSNLIRSNHIAWNLNIRNPQTGNRTSLTIDLELSLWDEPVSAGGSLGGFGGFGIGGGDNLMNGAYPNGNNNTSFTSFLLQQNGGNASILPDSAATNFHTDNENLARSLQRHTNVNATMDDTEIIDTFIVPTNFNNFSTLFGIGQYITLSPIAGSPIPSTLLDYLLDTNSLEGFGGSGSNSGGAAILSRHDDINTSRYVVGSILSQWLQTSLNIATSNVQCCIPVFGIWGAYQPLSGYQRHTIVLENENDDDEDDDFEDTSEREQVVAAAKVETPRKSNNAAGNEGNNGGGAPTSILRSSSKFSRSSSQSDDSDDLQDRQQQQQSQQQQQREPDVIHVWKRVPIPAVNSSITSSSSRRPTSISTTSNPNNKGGGVGKMSKNLSSISLSSTNSNSSNNPNLIAKSNNINNNNASNAPNTNNNPNANFYTTSSIDTKSSLLVLPNWSHAIMNETSLSIPVVNRRFKQQASVYNGFGYNYSADVDSGGESTYNASMQSNLCNSNPYLRSGYWNMKFRPPIITGSVIVPSTIDCPAIHATFWCSVTTYTPGLSYEYNNSIKKSSSMLDDADTSSLYEDAMSVASQQSYDSRMSGTSSSNRRPTTPRRGNNSKNAPATSTPKSGMIMNTKYSRLIEWSNVLLQHCNPNDVTVVLHSAKHVYGWYRPSNYHPELIDLIGSAGNCGGRRGGSSSLASSRGGRMASSIFAALTRNRGGVGGSGNMMIGGSGTLTEASKMAALLEMTEWRSMSITTLPTDDGMNNNDDGGANVTTIVGNFGNITSMNPYPSASSSTVADKENNKNGNSKNNTNGKPGTNNDDSSSADDNMDDILKKAIANTIDLTKSQDEDDGKESTHSELRSVASMEDFEEQKEREFEIYRIECRNHVLNALHVAWGTPQRGIDLPLWLWGPLEDPVSNIHVTCTWTGRKTNTSSGTISNKSNAHYHTSLANTAPTGIIVEPLITFPLRIRSQAGKQNMSRSDWREIEESVEQSILNPLSIPSPSPSINSNVNFGVSVSFDREIPVATLAAQQKCLLATLIRAATLPRETMLHHLTDRSLVELWDDDAGTVVATKFAQRANVGRTTQALVRAMDWHASISDLIDTIDAEAVIHNIMNGSLTASIPVSPESSFSPNDIYSPFRKTAPYGRLLSVLFAHMSQTRCLSSMALIWNIFCQELRRRWENRESLPNMQYVPGLDPNPLELYEQRCFSTIGLKANFASFLHCSEPDPDDYHCLIGQKLQVFNLGIENLVATEIAEHEAMERFLFSGDVAFPGSGKKNDPIIIDDAGKTKNAADGDPYAADRRGGFERVPSTMDIMPSSVGATSATTASSSSGGRPSTKDRGEDSSKRKWPKARDMPINPAGGGDIDNYSNDQFDNYGSGMNYGPPTINTDLEFWVMDEPGFGPKLDETPLDYAEVAHDSDEFGNIATPSTNLDEALGELDFSQLMGKKEQKKKKYKAGEGGGGVVGGVRRRFQRRRSSMGGSSVLSGDSDTASRGSRGAGRKKSSGAEPRTIVVDGLPDAQGGAWEGMIAGGSGGSVATSCSQSQQYFDAAEAGSIFSMKNGFVDLDTVINVEELQSRPGARCPVHGISAGHNGDQLYAPYLQRPYPLTDDIVLERRLMLSQPPPDSKNRQKKGTLQFRIEVSQRLQKPKLLSDMKAFKAANPNSNFEDFTKWYGNPGSPLEDYNNDDLMMDPNDGGKKNNEHSVARDVNQLSAAMKLDKASEAMKILIATRDFWAETWEEAIEDPAPASEQPPLFNVTSTVEMTLDYLERMHPACLVNQVLAVNLSAAYFTLISSASQTMHVGAVETSLEKLRNRVDRALHLLARDATHGSKSVSTGDDGDNNATDSASAQAFASEETLSACEEACNALSESETLVARAMSLLHKFPKQYDLVHNLLKVADGSIVSLSDNEGRGSILRAIYLQQKRPKRQMAPMTPNDMLPVPLLREYILRNLDDSCPCQLSVRFGDKGAYLDTDMEQEEGAIVLALTKSFAD